MKLKITYYLSLLLCSISISGYAQLTDNFTDGNFTYAPLWNGNDTDFIVNTHNQLQLNSSGTSESYLITNNTQPLSNCEWNFWINLDFSPSSGNYARVYLASNTPNLSGSLNGYYLQFGENSSTDKIELFRQNGTAFSSLCRGTTSIANAFIIRVKVTRDNIGLWKLYVDPTGGANYTLEASGTDNAFTNTSFFGIYCNYTSTNATQFYFDDFYIYSPPDITAAVLDSVEFVSSNKLDAYFSEDLSTISAQTIANYSINNGIGFASAAIQDSSRPSLVHLTFLNNFVNEQYYTLTVTGVQDFAGNNTLNSANTFLFFLPQANDVVINEIMADVNPIPNTLPPFEYIELYNRTIFPVKLNGWTLSDASSTVTFPAITILADSFYVLGSVSGAAAFTGIAVAGLSSFPSLNDSGDDLILRDANGNIISVAFYRSDWYNDPIKNEGGWSLEQIDPNSPCSGKLNWKAAADNSGGTPGKTNSVFASVPDIIPPTLSHATIISSNSIRLFFSESMDSATLMNVSAYSIDNGIGNPVSANPIEPDYTGVTLTLSSPIITGTMYTITVNFVRDCGSNLIATNSTTQFAMGEIVSTNDVVINEVLFEPKEDGIEWIEIYNRSNKVIDLKELYLCSQNKSGNLTDINQISPDGYLFLPQHYVVLSTDAGSIKTQYTTTNASGFIDMNAIPSLSNDSDDVLLINVSQTVIDKLHYHSEWHLPLLNDTKGISLERINYDKTTQDESNWHSASESSGGATPAFKNSQYTSGEEGTEIIISPEIFSPDNDGYNDILSINYTFDTPGMIGNLNIYDSRGRLVRTLVRNELLATTGAFFWDGITDDKLKARMGIYVIYLEAFDTKGKVKKYKKTCVVAGKL